MILFSLEDPQDIALCGGRKRGRYRTHPRENLTAGSTHASKWHKIGSAYGRGAV